MDITTKMKIFIRITELGSFTKTAETMNLPKATVSTAIQDLEAALDTRLLQRTTRQVSLTDDGRHYLERCKNILNDIESAQSMFQVRPEKIKGRVRVDMASSMATGIIIPHLSDLLTQHAGLEVEISSTDQTVDLIRDGIDCAIRSGNLSQQGTIEKKIGQVQMINAVSPNYIKKYGKPKSLSDLKKHKLIFYTQTLGARRWGFEYFNGQSYEEIKMQGDVTVNNTDAFRAACLAGLGIIQAPAHGLRPYLKSGQLLEVLPTYRAEPLPIKIVYSERRLMAPRVRVVIDWLEKVIKGAISTSL